MQTIELERAKMKLVELLEQAAAGEDIVITKNDKPFVKLVSEQPARRPRQAGSALGQIIIADDFDALIEDFKEYM